MHEIGETYMHRYTYIKKFIYRWNETLLPERDNNSHDGPARQVGEWLQLFDEILIHNQSCPEKSVVVVWATNHPDAIDKAVWYEMLLLIENQIFHGIH